MHTSSIFIIGEELNCMHNLVCDRADTDPKIQLRACNLSNQIDSDIIYLSVFYLAFVPQQNYEHIIFTLGMFLFKESWRNTAMCSKGE